MSWYDIFRHKPKQPVEAPSDPMGGAVVAGLLRVSASRYGGWNGYCAGADVNADEVADMLRQRGFAVSVHRDRDASFSRLIKACEKMEREIPADKPILLYIAGHGGQKPDVSGDEADGMDETLCLWDKELLDDRICELLSRFPASRRILFVTDTCNSGTNVRSIHPTGIKAQVIHYGGCGDGKSSHGDRNGSLFTDAWIATLSNEVTYETWHYALYNRMVDETGDFQIPVYGEYGPVTEAFRNTQALK